MLDGQRTEQARALIELCKERGLMIGTAESCTGGLLSAYLTAVPGSSSVFERGFITYSNGAKIEMLGVDADLLAAYGAVSEPVARAMAEGVLARAPVDLAVSITGVAGPGGGSADKPVGLVFIGSARKTSDGSQVTVERHEFGNVGRNVVRERTVAVALDRLLQLAQGSKD
jgi:nicotinamide-nucleotide amidase